MISALLEVRNLTKTYRPRGGLFGRSAPVRAVDTVSFTIPTRTTFGLVGESGCGKTTLSRLVLRLMRPDSGEILFKGRDLVTMDGRELRHARRDIAMVFQSPYTSLNPRMTVEDLIASPLVIHRQGDRASRSARVGELLDAVGMPASARDKYPHEFSGGQRQRIGIARALALRPSLVICDEPTSALDVSVQAQILNLFKDLQSEFALTYLFISHDMAVIEHISDTVGVMSSGRIVEIGSADDLFASPRHPYTRTLFAAVPRIGATDAPPETSEAP